MAAVSARLLHRSLKMISLDAREQFFKWFDFNPRRWTQRLGVHSRSKAKRQIHHLNRISVACQTCFGNDLLQLAQVSRPVVIVKLLQNSARESIDLTFVAAVQFFQEMLCKLVEVFHSVSQGWEQHYEWREQVEERWDHGIIGHCLSQIASRGTHESNAGGRCIFAVEPVQDEPLDLKNSVPACRCPGRDVSSRSARSRRRDCSSSNAHIAEQSRGTNARSPVSLCP